MPTNAICRPLVTARLGVSALALRARSGPSVDLIARLQQRIRLPWRLSHRERVVPLTTVMGGAALERLRPTPVLVPDDETHEEGVFEVENRPRRRAVGTPAPLGKRHW